MGKREQDLLKAPTEPCMESLGGHIFAPASKPSALNAFPIGFLKILQPGMNFPKNSASTLKSPQIGSPNQPHDFLQRFS